MEASLIMQWLAGTWFIITSDAPIWLKGDKQSPSLNYTITGSTGSFKLLDETRYFKGRRQKAIAGYDRPVPGNEHGFIWRGKGLLFFVTSKWEVRLRDPEGAWAVIIYSKTLFTPEGADLIARTSHLSASKIEAIRKQMLLDPVLAQHVDKMMLIKSKELQ